MQMTGESLMVLPPARPCVRLLQVTSHPSSPPTDMRISITPLLSAPVVAMTLNLPHSSSNGGFIPMFTKSNFLKWEMCIKAYLTRYNHVHIIILNTCEPPPVVGLILLCPLKLRSWRVGAHHLELVRKHKKEGVWDLWLVIEAKHMKQDTGLYHGT